MKVINLNQQIYSLRYIPRVYNYNEVGYILNREYGDVSLETEIEFLPVDDNLGYKVLDIDLSSLTIKEGDSYTITLFDSNDILYRAKLYFTEQTDLQNFSLTKQILFTDSYLLTNELERLTDELGKYLINE